MQTQHVKNMRSWSSITAPALRFSKWTHDAPFQYCSDVHVDVKARQNIQLTIVPTTKTLMVAGDVGNPFCPSFESFFGHVSNAFSTVLFVPGNHDHNHGCIFHPLHAKICKPRIRAILRQFPNVHLLDNDAYDYSEHTLVIGTQLYSQLSPTLRKTEIDRYDAHNAEHAKCVDMVEFACRTTKKNVIVLSHYVPTFRLIEEKYQKFGSVQSKWTTDLEDVMEKHSNLGAWICGHTHSVKKAEIKHLSGHSTTCLVNAIG